MERRTMLRTSIAALAGLTTVGTASGQSNNSTASQAAQSASEQTESEPTYLAQSGPLKVRDYEAEDLGESEEEDAEKARVTVSVTLDRPAAVTLSDPFGGFVSEGVTQIDTKVIVPDSGRSRLSHVTTQVEGVAALGIGTEDGPPLAISTGFGGGGGSGVGLMEGAAYGGATMLSGATITAWKKSRNDLDEPEEAEIEGKGGLL
jgi:hypothetical protein